MAKSGFGWALLALISIVGDLNAKGPNVLLIVSDDLNRHLAITGYDQVATPALT